MQYAEMEDAASHPIVMAAKTGAGATVDIAAASPSGQVTPTMTAMRMPRPIAIWFGEKL